MSINGPNFSNLERMYRLSVLQNPVLGGAHMGQFLSRLPLQPPLVVQLDTWDRNNEEIIPLRFSWDELPFLVCHLALQTPDGEEASAAVTAEGDTTMLYGSLASPAYDLYNLSNELTICFVFPDVAVRFPGTFRLKAYVMRITGGPSIITTYSKEFDVVPESEFVAVAPTELTVHIAQQNVVRGLTNPDW